MTKPKITMETKVMQKDKIISYGAKRMVVETGNGAHIMIPKELIGKIIEINWSEKK